MGADVLIIVAKVVLTLTWTLLLALFLTWVERKESAIMQDRIGANRASVFGLRLFGLFQPFADAIKMLFKEDFVPSFAQRTLHWLAPAFSFLFVSVTMVAVPFGDTVRLFGRDIPLQVVDLNAAVLFVLAMLSLGIYGILISGWASSNRFALIGIRKKVCKSQASRPAPSATLADMGDSPFPRPANPTALAIPQTPLARPRIQHAARRRQPSRWPARPESRLHGMGHARKCRREPPPPASRARR